MIDTIKLQRRVPSRARHARRTRNYISLRFRHAATLKALAHVREAADDAALWKARATRARRALVMARRELADVKQELSEQAILTQWWARQYRRVMNELKDATSALIEARAELDACRAELGAAEFCKAHG